MRLFFASSALIPVFYADDARHAVSVQAFLAAGPQTGFCALWTLGEVYAVLTGLPVRPRIAGRDGIKILRQIMDRLTLTTLSSAEYVEAIENVSGSIVGGTVYDAIIAQCAVKARAEVLLTWNERDFRRVGRVAKVVKTPLDFLNMAT